MVPVCDELDRWKGLCCFWNWSCKLPLKVHSHVVYITESCSAQAYNMNAVQASLFPKIACINKKMALLTQWYTTQSFRGVH